MFINHFYSLYAYRFILYFVLAAKEKKDPDYIGKYIYQWVNTQPKRALIYTGMHHFDRNEHPYKNLMRRCGLRPGYIYTSKYLSNVSLYNIPNLKEGFYLELVLIKKKYTAEDIKKRWKYVNINFLIAAHEHMGNDLFLLALKYIKNKNKDKLLFQ